MQFACKQLNLDEVVKCSLGLTRAEYRVLKKYMNLKNQVTLAQLAKKTNLDRTTVQKASLKLVEKGLLSRSQHNRESGGYEFLYKIKDKDEIRNKARSIVRDWYKAVDEGLNSW